MTTKPVSVGTLKKGSTVVIDGSACKVTDTQVSRPGKHGHAKVRLTAIGLIDDKKRVIVMPGHDSIDTPIIDKKTAQVLSIAGDNANVMDMETYETFDLESKFLPKSRKKSLTYVSILEMWVGLKNNLGEEKINEFGKSA